MTKCLQCNISEFIGPLTVIFGSLESLGEGVSDGDLISKSSKKGVLTEFRHILFLSTFVVVFEVIGLNKKLSTAFQNVSAVISFLDASEATAYEH